MTLDAFVASLAGAEPPDSLAPALRALWWDGRDDWARAHDMVAESETGPSAWVHAYLHRKEGDTGNARYWYGRAGRAPASGPLDEEWRGIAVALLER